jgi:hypothetical protein
MSAGLLTRSRMSRSDGPPTPPQRVSGKTELGSERHRQLLADRLDQTEEPMLILRADVVLCWKRDVSSGDCLARPDAQSGRAQAGDVIPGPTLRVSACALAEAARRQARLRRRHICALRLPGCTTQATQVRLDPALEGNHDAAALSRTGQACCAYCSGAIDASRAHRPIGSGAGQRQRPALIPRISVEQAQATARRPACSPVRHARLSHPCSERLPPLLGSGKGTSPRGHSPTPLGPSGNGSPLSLQRPLIAAAHVPLASPDGITRRILKVPAHVTALT